MLRQAPARVAILTSIRDTGKEDRNGAEVQTRQGKRYMMGMVEFTVQLCSPGGSLHGLMEIAGVVTDDLPRHLSDSEYPCAPTRNRPWIHPLALRDYRGHLIIDRTVHVPSTFRLISISDREARRQAKLRFEERIREAILELGADIVIFDHYMGKSEHLHRWMPAVNIHPAVTRIGDPYCFRGKTPTADALAMARSGQVTMTGATLHMVNDKIDDGPIICCGAHTPVFADDTPEELRWRNYQRSKRRVFAEGIHRYLTQVYPRLAANAA